MTRILVVEDEDSFSDALSYLLRMEGFDVDVATTGKDALIAFYQSQIDLILLDLMLPEMSGIDVCMRVREHSQTPIIMVTAKDSEVDKVVGLELGADDYITKPYSQRELLARIRAVLRRAGSEPEERRPHQVLVVGPVRMDVERHIVTTNGEPIQLPLKEFELLQLLLSNPGKVLTRGQILDRIWGAYYRLRDTRTLDVHVKRLRNKIEREPSRPRHLVTVRGLGYKFEP